jgi:hypothetical protein
VWTSLTVERQGYASYRMTFKKRPNSYSISVAPTDRARCKHCRAVIPKGATRVVTHAFVRPNRATRFYRCASTCIDTAFATAVLCRHKRAERVPATADVPDNELGTIRRALDQLGAASSAPRAPAPRCTQPSTSPPLDERQAPIQRYLLIAHRTPCNPLGSSDPRYRTE